MYFDPSFCDLQRFSLRDACLLKPAYQSVGVDLTLYAAMWGIVLVHPKAEAPGYLLI